MQTKTVRTEDRQKEAAKKETSFDQANEKFSQLLDKRGLKYTPERRRLLNRVLKITQHFTADGLYETLRTENIRISRDTVFRTMPLLLECGVIQKSVGDGRCEYFEPLSDQNSHHDHMVCLSCGQVLEFSSDEIESQQERLCKELGFQLVFHDHRLFGYCCACQTPPSPSATH